MGDETSASSVDHTTVVTATSSPPVADASLSGPAGKKGTPQVSGGEGYSRFCTTVESLGSILAYSIGIHLPRKSVNHVPGGAVK